MCDEYVMNRIVMNRAKERLDSTVFIQQSKAVNAKS